jgi:hypothetical protein
MTYMCLCFLYFWLFFIFFILLFILGFFFNLFYFVYILFLVVFFFTVFLIFICCFSKLYFFKQNQTNIQTAILFFLQIIILDILFRPFGFIAFKTLNYLFFQSFCFDHTWWRLFRKRVMRVKFDIYVFIIFCLLVNNRWPFLGPFSISLSTMHSKFSN